MGWGWGWCWWGVGIEALLGSSPLTRSAMNGSMMSEALLLLARDDGAGASRSQAPPWKTSDAGGASSL